MRRFLLTLLAALPLAAAPSAWTPPNKRAVLVDIAIANRKAYVVEQLPGPAPDKSSTFLNTLDLSNPDRPVALGRVALPRTVSALSAHGTEVFVSLAEETLDSGKGGLLLYDMTRPGRPRLAHRFPPGEIDRITRGQDVALLTQLEGSRLYVSGARGVLIYERARKGPPRLVGSRTGNQMSAATSVVRNRILFTVETGEKRQLVIEDVQNPARAKTSVATKSGIHRYVIYRDRFYVPDYAHGLVIGRLSR